MTQLYNYVACGDSITFGYALPAPNTPFAYPARAAALMGPAFGTPTNRGLTGYRLDELTAGWVNNGAASLRQDMPNIVSMMGGINNILSDNISYSALLAMVQAWRAAVATSFAANTGGHPNYQIWGTLTAIENGNTAKNATRAQINAYMRANYVAEGFDGLFDFGIGSGPDPYMGLMPFSPATPSNIYFVDGLHPTILGQELLAFDAAREFKRLGFGATMTTDFNEYLVARNARLSALLVLLNGGKLKIYSGPKPAVDVAPTGTLLATLTLNATAGTVSAGVLTFNAITQDSSAAATGTAGYAVLEEADSSTVVATGTIGTSGTDFVIVSTSIVAGTPVTCTAGSITAP